MANSSGIRAARPTIAIDGRDNASLADGLLNLQIVEAVSGVYRCEALFGNWGTKDNNLGFLYFDRQLLDFGKGLKVKIGSSVIFDGRVTGLEANFPDGRAPEINVLAEDRFQDLRMTRRTRTFADVSDSDVMSQIAGDHGLTGNVDVSGPTHKVLAQVNQSDLAFLRERARAIDAELWMDGSTLRAQSHGSRDGGTVQLRYQRDLREFAVLSDLAGQRTSVFVNGWDVAGKKAIQHEATASAISGELNGDDSGPSILSSAFGDRKEALAHTVPLTADQAQSEAEAFFRMSARRFVVGRGVAEADARIRVGSVVDLQALGPLFSGKYYVAEVRHVFDARGIRTEFTGERPGLGRR
jgi:phage protein D